MPVFKYLDTSTSAITENDTLRLHDKDNLPMRVIDHEYGWWINVQQDEETYKHVISELIKRSVSQGFLRLMQTARVEGCNWINLDQDGELHPGLKTYDWPSSRKQKHIPPAKRTMYTNKKKKR